MSKQKHSGTTPAAGSTLRLAPILWLFAITSIASGSLQAQVVDFQTIVEWTNGLSPHYTCGAPGEQACFTGCANSNGIKLYGDPYTGNVNCDLPPSGCTMSGGLVPSNPHDITFMVMTDVHLRNGHGITDYQHAFHTFAMRQIGNNGWKWNQSNAGFPADRIVRPLAAVSTGDETNDGQQTSLGAFRLLYENNWSSDALGLPLFPGYGNHDVQNDCEFGNCGKRMLDYATNAASCNPNGVDPESRNYSWEWGKYHMVQLNNWAGDTMAGTNNSFIPSVKDTHGSGLPWLIADLAIHVGNSGRPVILFQHYGWDPFSKQLNTDGTPTWWSDSDRQSLLAVIQNYNIAAIITGHDHNLGSNAIITANNKTLDGFVGGTGGQSGYGEFFVVRLTDQFLDLMPVRWADPLINPKPGFIYPTLMGTSGDHPNTRSAFFNNVQGCRKWVGPALNSTPVALSGNGNTYTIKNTTPNTLPGPFALRFSSLNGSIPAEQDQVLFAGNCAVGPLYVLSSSVALAPGESATFQLSAQMTNTTAPDGVATLGGDYLEASPNPVVLPATETQSVHITTAYGASVPFTVKAEYPWLKVAVASGQTPATLTLSVDQQKITNNPESRVFISSTNPAYPKTEIMVTLASVPVTFTSPDSEQISVDGTVASTPVTFDWIVNSKHKIVAQTQIPRPGVQDRFLGWAQPGETFTLTVSKEAATFAVKFQQYLQVTTSVVPAAAGGIAISPSSQDGYYVPGTKLALTATANPGFVFDSFGDQPQGANPATFTLTKNPLRAQAKFLAAGSYSISTSLGAAGSETIDGVPKQGPAVVQWALTTHHTVSVPALVSPSPGTQYVFVQWSDGLKLASRDIGAGSIVSFVAQYQQQFQVNVAASPSTGGSVSGGGWYNANAAATLTASAASGFNFTGFSGGASSVQTPFTLTVASPENLIANFAPGTPVLVASAGAHTNTNATRTELTLVVTNTGAAASTIIDSITAVAQGGTGTVTPLPVLPVATTIYPGKTLSFGIPVAWPSTATRVAFTVHFSANSGAYTGKSTIYVIR